MAFKCAIFDFLICLKRATDKCKNVLNFKTNVSYAETGSGSENG